MTVLNMLRSAAAGAAALVAAGAASAADTIKLAVTDIAGLERLQTEFGTFQKVLSERTGMTVEFFPVSSRTAVVEALAAKRVDFVLTGPAEYVVIGKRTDAYPVVGFGRPDYFAAIVVMADSGYNLPKDITGKKVAMGDVGSTSNHLAPAQVLADFGVDPKKDVQIVHTSANVAWEALKRGDVAAIGMNHGKFLSVRAKDKDLEPGAFKVIGRGPDLPNDVLMAGRHVPEETVAKLRAAFDGDTRPLVEAVLVGEDNQKYLGMKFLPTVKDADYNYVRSMYATIGFPEYADFVGN